MTNHFKNKNSFTLLETMVVIAITTIVGAALASMIQSFYRTNDYVIQETTAVQSARQGLGIALKNLREASYGADGSYPIASAATSSITFFADTNGDGTVEEVKYSLVRGTLYKIITLPAGNPPSYAGQIQSTTTIATYLVNTAIVPLFTYTNSSGVQLATTTAVDPSQIQTVTATLKVDVDPNRSPSPYTLNSTIALRNLNGQ
jgi:type II secretory pathway pseudopilin PulG